MAIVPKVPPASLEEIARVLLLIAEGAERCLVCGEILPDGATQKLTPRGPAHFGCA